MTETFYDVLEVAPDASQEAITDAYREQVKQYHPDVSDHENARERFKRIKRAESVLGDPDERAAYDRVGHERYVDGMDGTVGGADRDDEPTAGAAWASAPEDVRTAAARAAASETTDAGGRSAGWRERERAGRRADWDVGFGRNGSSVDDPDVGFGTTVDDATVGDDADDRERTASTSPSGSAATGWASVDGTGQRASGSTATGAPNQGPTYAVRREAPSRTASIRRQLAGDDAMSTLSMFVFYPTLLWTATLPVFPIAANVTLGILALACVAIMLPRPPIALAVFGPWSLLAPALLVGVGVPLWSATGMIVLGGVWIPLLFSLTVALVLIH